MARPKFFRDPLHLQIRFDPSDGNKGKPKPRQPAVSILQKINDTPEFQRLRFIRQNGLANLVFHGAEHSRFAHSLGVMHVARTMYERVSRNMSEDEDKEIKLFVQIAALVHDVGHGAFSHSLEEILKENKIEFRHETMTKRFITEDDSAINQILSKYNKSCPAKVVQFFDKTKRKKDHWSYRIVSSQMDADRLDYVQRDALFAGLKGHGFDIERVLDLLYHHDNSIAVDRGAIEAVEAYLVTIDQLYRAIYYHHAVRAATQILLSLFKRAFYLYKNGDKTVFRELNGNIHPLVELFEKGDTISLNSYQRLTDFVLWSLVDEWQMHRDIVLSDLSKRLLTRNLLKTIQIDPLKLKEYDDVLAKARGLAEKKYGKDCVEYYVMVDEPSRTSYKKYDWMRDAPDESIWLLGGERKACPLEDEEGNALVSAFKQKTYFPRLILPDDIREQVS
jgi:uncharacterized protein